MLAASNHSLPPLPTPGTRTTERFGGISMQSEAYHTRNGRLAAMAFNRRQRGKVPSLTNSSARYLTRIEAAHLKGTGVALWNNALNPFNPLLNGASTLYLVSESVRKSCFRLYQAFHAGWTNSSDRWAFSFRLCGPCVGSERHVQLPCARMGRR